MTFLPLTIQANQREGLYSTGFAGVRRTQPISGLLRGLLFNGLLLLTVLHANAQTTWTRRDQALNQILFDVAYGAGKYVTVGNGGLIHISTDGIAWTTQVAYDNAAGALRSILYVNGQFVAVGSYGQVRTSPDGLTWSSQVSGTTNSLNGLAYGGGRFIAVGDKGTAITSTDGIAWSTLTTGTSVDLNDITYGSGTFTIVGNGGLIRTTPNGIIWTAKASGTAVSLEGVTARANGQVVAVGSDNTIVRSPDGIVWTAQVVAGTPLPLLAITYDPVQSLYVAVSETSFGSHQLLRSTDGINWSTWSSGTSSGLHGVRYVNDRFVAVGVAGTILSSLNGSSWYHMTISDNIQFRASAYGNGRYVAVGKYPINLQPAVGSVAVTSTDGINYTLGTTEHFAGADEGFNDVVWGNGQFVAVGGEAIIQTSVDGKAWKLRYSGLGALINGVAYGNGQYVAVGAGLGAGINLLRSPDGITWTKGATGLPAFYYGITHANGQFVAVGSNGAIATSPEGVDWTGHFSGTNKALTSVVYGNGTYVALGVDGTVIRSVNSTNWSAALSFTNNDSNRVTFGNGQFVTVGKNGELFTSPDGAVWTARQSMSNNDMLVGITHGNGLFVAVGNKATVVTSPDDAGVQPVNQPPVAPFIPNTTGTLGQVYSQIIPLFTDPEGLPLTYSVTGLPPGLLVSAGGNMVGPPSTAGVYPITVTATDPGGLSASASYTLTIGPAGGGGFQLTAPLYNCQSGAFTFQTSGGDGSSIEYMAIGITGWTTNPSQFVDFGLRTATDAQPLTLKARQNGIEVTLPFSIQAFCSSEPVIPVNPPVAGALQLTAPVYNCQSGAFTFQTTGGDGNLIEYMAIGITGWTTNPNQFMDFELRTATDAQPLTLKARQSGIEVTRMFDRQLVCANGNARAGVSMEALEVRLSVVAYPNPVTESFTVDIDGIRGELLRLRLVDMLGNAVVEREVQVVESSHRALMSLGQQPAGLYLLQVSTPGQTQTVKVLKH